MGVEVVGEILEQYPNKQMTIVHPSNSLMDGWPSGGILLFFSSSSSRFAYVLLGIKKTQNWMQEKGKCVNVVLGKKLVRSEGNQHELSDGSIIEGITSLFSISSSPSPSPPLLSPLPYSPSFSYIVFVQLI